MKKLLIRSLLTAAIIVLLLFSAGCTENHESPDQIPTEETGQQPKETSQEPTAAPTESVESSQYLSWKDCHPDYDDQMKPELIENAKNEIVRVFPEVDSDTLEGLWDESGDIYTFPYPYIRFDNVTNNIEGIDVDPTSNKIIGYGTRSFSALISSPNRVSFKTAVNKSLDFIRKIMGDEYMDRIGDDLVLNPEEFDGGCLVEIYDSYEGVEYYYSNLGVDYDLRSDEIQCYEDRSVNKSLLTEHTTLSPEPDITLDEAKEILKSKLNKSYGLDYEGIEFVDKDGRGLYPSLYWYDSRTSICSDDPEPFRLIWSIPYTTEDQRSEEGYDKKIDAPEEVIIDAHTGEILYLHLHSKDELVIHKLKD